jgi:hypothetical protein
MNRTVPHPSQTELRRAEEFTWGPRPTTAPNSSPPKMRLREWRWVRKSKLLGFATVELPNGLVICDAPVMAGTGGPWATLPAKPELDRDGRRKLDANGKPIYTPALRWSSCALVDQFSAAVVELVRAAHPEALADAGPS